MANYQLELKQLQKLVMTTELRQAIDLLTMPVLELQQFVREQLETNPMLEDESYASEAKSAAESFVFEELSREDTSKQLGYFVNREEKYSPEARTEVFNNLYEYLLFQLDLLPITKEQLRIGKYIISYIDDNGYLLALPETIAKELGIGTAEIEAIMEMIRDFDPPGVCCRNLQDCLTLQLNREHPYYEELKTIIGQHLELVASNRVPQLARVMKLPKEVISELVETIRSLNPRPGSCFETDVKTEYVSPDVTVQKNADGWQVILNEWGVPNLLVNDYYRNMVKSGIAVDEATEEYLKAKLHSALWVLKAIEQRRKTIYDTVNAILKFQTAYFNNGAEFPVPLNLKAVADEIGVHESTVSRAIGNKYLQTPRGLYSFKYFFPKGLDSDHNTLAIKEALRNLIEQEDPAKPLKDGELADRLTAQGINISRRTVAKYREQMGIVVAGKRKQY